MVAGSTAFRLVKASPTFLGINSIPEQSGNGKGSPRGRVTASRPQIGGQLMSEALPDHADNLNQPRYQGNQTEIRPSQTGKIISATA
jgi:hypothetical protein